MNNKFYLNRLRNLIGARVVSVITDNENAFFGLQLKLSSGELRAIWFLSDDEGNAPGSFSIEEATS